MKNNDYIYFYGNAVFGHAQRETSFKKTNVIV